MPCALITGGRGAVASELAAQLTAAGVEVLAPGRDELDVSVAESVEQFFADSVTGPLDLLVNNAGITDDAPLARLDAERFSRVLEVNLDGAFRCSRRALRSMLRARSGHIVNIGSYSALSGPAGQANYAASKAALIGFGQSLAKEAGARGVRVNTVMPGYLEETRMTSAVPGEIEQQVRESHALGRFNTVADAARFIVFLHQQMTNVSGQVFQLDSRIGRWT